ncbi:CDP-glycerol glycerophosphotransferase family protein [Mycoplasma sp. P36-A1]|uniref:CDP-glycerol glycerophosphotransferase family protein n=1 Tax=Mycoplasma sp. P36-A1 TaxID=3252900 RepID=UPI003C2D52A3
MKRKLLLVPSAYNIRAIGDVINFVDYYKDSLDIYILVKDIPCDVQDCLDYQLVNIQCSYGKYLRDTAEYVIDAGSINSRQRKGKNQYFVSIWHGIPYKKMFVDKLPPEIESANLYANAYDLMISSSNYYTEIFLRKAMLYNKEIRMLGCSRMDSLFNKSLEEINELKNNLNIPLDKKVVLYAPTFKDIKNETLPFNLNDLLNSFNDEYVLVIKMHYLSNITIKNKNVINLTNYHNISDILLCSDLLISDYSSVIFDYSILNRPIILLQNDKQEYLDKRGLSFNIEDYVSKESLIYNIDDLYKLFKNNDFKKIKNNLKQHFYPLEDGQSSKRIVESLNFNTNERKHEDIIFIINDLNEIGGLNTFINNMAKYYKNKYDAKIIVIAMKEFANKNSEVYILDSKYIDYTLSSTYQHGTCVHFLKNTTGYIISLQFSAHRHFQRWMRNKNTILMFHGDSQLIIDADVYKFHLKSLNMQKLYNYKRLLFLSKKNEDNIREHLSLEVVDKLDFQHNSIDLKYTPLSKETHNSFAFIGRLSDEKNPLALLKLAKLIKSNKSNIIINVYGDGPLKEELVSKVNKQKLNNIIIFHGYVENKEDIFSKNNGLILLSKNEGFPYVILEAYAYGRPVIAFNTFTAASEMILSSKTGYLVDNLDYEQLYNALLVSDKLLNSNYIKQKFSNYQNNEIFNKWNQLFIDIKEEKAIDKISTAKKNITHKKLIKEFKAYVKSLPIFPEKYFSLYKDQVTNTKNLNIINSEYQDKASVSIIIPAFNASKSIKACIDSIIIQGIILYEIIVIDDGSDDVESLNDIINCYKIKNINIRLFKTTNNGPGKARNYGIEQAVSNYIFFLDADDLLPQKSLSSLLLFALRNDLNVVSGLTQRHYLESDKTEPWHLELYKRNEIYKSLDERFNIYEDTLATNKLYKKEVFSKYDLYFEKGLYEDKIFTSKLYAKVPKIGFIKTTVYLWCVYGSYTSITTHKSYDNFCERMNAINRSWFNFNEIVRYKMFAYFLKHDLMIYLREFCFYTVEQQEQIYVKANEFILANKKYYYPNLLKNANARTVYDCFINNDLERFILVSNYICQEYQANVAKNTKTKRVWKDII